MSAGLVYAIAEGLRYNDVEVTFEPGCLTRGNGFSFPGGLPRGCPIHHTGAEFDAGLWTLLQGRPDLDPPLCNSCGYSDGRVHILAAHVANHAGASGGKSMGPLPVTRLFNPLVWGHEIMYPGIMPMTAAQQRSALILGGVICGILGVSAEHVRLHHETSVTGKWDAGAGRGAGIPLDGNVFRSKIWPTVKQGLESVSEQLGVDDMPAGTMQVGAEPMEFELCMPVGEASGLVHTGWLGVSLSKGGRIEAAAYGGPGRLLGHWHAVKKPHERMWCELPSGAEAYAVKVVPSAPGSVGWCFELRPRKDIAQ